MIDIDDEEKEPQVNVNGATSVCTSAPDLVPFVFSQDPLGDEYAHDDETSFDSNMNRIRWSYRDQVILAPMVRVGTLPMRLLSLKYGATMVYNEELIDFKMMKCERVVNSRTGTVDFALPNRKDAKGVIFRTVPNEPVVFQVGTADPQRALKVAKLVEKDVRAIDVNMGCPKGFSVHAGMGAALLRTPQKVKEILTTLVQGVSIPVTCKIRLLEDPEETMELVRMIEKTGVKALGVHARYRPDRPRQPARVELVAQIAKELSIPVIFNGDIFDYKHIAKAKEVTGCASVMLARGPQWNASVFRPQGFLPLARVARDYFTIAKHYDNLFPNTKYTLVQMATVGGLGKTDGGKAVLRAKNYDQMDEALKLFATEDMASGPFEVPDQKERSAFRTLMGEDEKQSSEP